MAGPEATALRERLGQHRPLITPGVFDAMSARMARQGGFEAVFVSGAATAAMAGLPDDGTLSLDDLARSTERICDAVSGTAVIVDLDTGYGAAQAISRAARTIASAGAAAVQVEDQSFPRTKGYTEADPVVSVEEMVARLVAVRQGDPDLVVIARTDCLGELGPDVALDRARALAAHADAVLITGIDRPTLDRAAGLGLRLAHISSSAAGAAAISAQEASDLDLAIVMYPIQAYRAALGAVRDYFAELATGAGSQPARGLSLAEIADLTSRVPGQ